MKRGFTLVELIIVVGIIGVMGAALFASYNNFKTKPISDRNGDGIIYYNDITPPEIVDYKEILQQYGIELSDEELESLIKELLNKGGTK